MAKSPAVNWYFDNWMGGTLGFNRHQKGCYMDLLSAQFQLGPLSLEQIRNILGSDFSQWETIKGKFIQNADGKFFNERLAAEIEKREQFIEKQRSNGQKGGRKRKGENPKETQPLTQPLTQNKPFYETEIETESLLGKGVQGENPSEVPLVPEMLSVFVKAIPTYPKNQKLDFPEVLKIAEFIADQLGVPLLQGRGQILKIWERLVSIIKADKFYGNKPLKTICGGIQGLYQQINNPTGDGSPSPEDIAKIKKKHEDEEWAKIARIGGKKSKAAAN